MTALERLKAAVNEARPVAGAVLVLAGAAVDKAATALRELAEKVEGGDDGRK